MTTIFLVCSSTGEYSDRREDILEAYADETKAEQRIVELNQWALTKNVWRGQDTIADYNERKEIGKELSALLGREHDCCEKSIKYTGIDFYLTQVELKE